MAERVHTYFSYDGEAGLPEEGIVNFNGVPHYFWLNQCCPEPHFGIFELAPASPALLSLSKEHDAIWRKWDLAYHAGEVELDTHPMRAGNNPRFAQLSAQIDECAAALRTKSIRATGVVSTATDYLEKMRPFVGMKWPVPGTYSAELEITWKSTT